MTTGKDLDILGLGPSAISQLADAFAQNARSTAEWQEAVTGDFATVRGIRLDRDDRLRGAVLGQLYGHGRIDKHVVDRDFEIAFDEYFQDELERLRVLEDDGLVHCGPGAVRLTEPLGRLLVRVVAAIFDSYLPANTFRQGLPAHLASRVG
jgi:oxygen-independent coproporphyrinogen-3 oxidase